MCKRIFCILAFTWFTLPFSYAQKYSSGKLTEFDEPNQFSASQSSRSLDPVLDHDESLAGLDDPGFGVGVEGLLGLALLDAPDGFASHLVAGGSVVWQVGRSLFRPEYEFWRKSLYWEASYLYTSSSEGTAMVEVNTQYHNLSTSLLFGLPLGKFLLYGKLGPALTIVPISYQVSNSTYENTPINTSHFQDLQWGVAYGLGARGVFYLSDHLGIIGRLEISRTRRSYFNDTYLICGAGLAF